MVIGGLAAFPFAEAKQVFRAWRDMTVDAPDDLMLVVGLLSAPDGSGNKIAAVAVGHTGTTAEGEAAIARIRSFGAVVNDALGPIPYSALNGMLDDGYPAGEHYYWKSAFMPKLTDDAIDTLIAAHERNPVPTNQLLLEHFHGAATRVPVDATAYALRDSGYNTLVLGHWADAAHGAVSTAWCRETFASLQTFVGKQRYMNYMDGDEEAGAAAVAAYGPNLARLRTLKKQYDPENVFHLNVNIPPA
jgi:hypothetical protein